MPANRATREDVLGIFDGSPAYSNRRRRPQSAPDVRRAVEAALDGAVADYPLRLLLNALVTDGSLVARTGAAWKGLPPSMYDVQRNTTYYTRPDVLAEWEEAQREAEAEALREKARAHAKDVLAERHSSEYDGLVAEFVAEREKEQG